MRQSRPYSGIVFQTKPFELQRLYSGLGFQIKPFEVFPQSSDAGGREDVAHIGQSRPDYGLGVGAKDLKTFGVVPSSLESGRREARLGGTFMNEWVLS